MPSRAGALPCPSFADREIDEKRTALKLLRGDFRRLEEDRGKPAQQVLQTAREP
ncbi:MAG TPA: hypothetical protein VFS39_11935 [Nitrospira sp.]|nr:hypothetical protein [Nitrospira sp.]